MTEKEERLARDRAEIAARVASFRETQQKFEREREEYYVTTLANALSGSGRLVLALRHNRKKLTRPSPLSPTMSRRTASECANSPRDFDRKVYNCRNEAGPSTFSSQVQQPCER